MSLSDGLPADSPIPNEPNLRARRDGKQRQLEPRRSLRPRFLRISKVDAMAALRQGDKEEGTQQKVPNEPNFRKVASH